MRWMPAKAIGLGAWGLYGFFLVLLAQISIPARTPIPDQVRGTPVLGQVRGILVPGHVWESEVMVIIQMTLGKLQFQVSSQVSALYHMQ